MKAERKVRSSPPRRKPHDDWTEVIQRFERLERFAEVAQRLPKAQIRRFRGDLNLINHNLERGLKAVLEQEKRIRAELPGVNLDELRELRDIMLALRMAARDAQDRTTAKKELQPLLAEARRLRRLLLTAAKTLVLAGIWEPSFVKSVSKGRGAFDTATDCIALADEFDAHEKQIRGKTPVTRDDIQKAHSVGNRLMLLIKPERARSRNDEPWRKAAEKRDRLWTLLHQRYELLWRVGAYLFGQAVTEHVPYLHTRRIRRKKAETTG